MTLPILQLNLADIPGGKGVEFRLSDSSPYVMTPAHARDMGKLLSKMAERAETAQGWK